MKAPGNITLGKTIEQHLASKVLVPFTVVRFYGEGTPERVAGKDVYITGWYNNRSGGPRRWAFTPIRRTPRPTSTAPSNTWAGAQAPAPHKMKWGLSKCRLTVHHGTRWNPGSRSSLG